MAKNSEPRSVNLVCGLFGSGFSCLSLQQLLVLLIGIMYQEMPSEFTTRETTYVWW